MAIGSEAALRSMVLDSLGPYGRVKRIESPIISGTPDISWLLRVRREPAIAGWMELKFLDNWPVRAATPIKIPHLTLEQSQWAHDWELVPGGRSPLLLQVKHDYCLFPGVLVKELFRTRPRPKRELLEYALVFQDTGHFPTAGILKALTSNEYNSSLHNMKGMVLS